MKRTLITPNSTSLPRPMHPRDTVVIPRDQSHDILSDHLLFVTVYVVDFGDVQADACKHGFPACDWMGSDNWMNRRELEVLVERRTTGRHYFVVACFASRLEDWLSAGGGECFHVGTP